MDPIAKVLTDPWFASQLSVGTIIVVIAAYIRFRTPPSLRSETTALRFYMATILYCLLALFLYYALTASPAIGLVLLKLLGTPDNALAWFNETLENFSPPLAMLALILALPSIPNLAKTDARIRQHFQRFAEIPLHVQRLSGRLASSSYELTPKDENEVRCYLKNQSFDIAFLDADAEIRELWKKITSLVLKIERWRGSNEFGGFFLDFNDKIDQILETYQAELPGAKNLFSNRRFIEELEKDIELALPKSNHALRESIRRSIGQIVKDYEVQRLTKMNEMYKQICDLVSRAVLANFQRRQRRDAAIRALGFQVCEGIGIGVNQAIFACCVLFLTVFASFVTLPLVWSYGGDLHLWESVVIGAFISAAYCIGVILALLSQQPETIRKATVDRRPWAHYVCIGGLAAAIAVPVYFIAAWILGTFDPTNDNELITKNFTLFLPMVLLASGSAAFTAFNIDNGVFDRPVWAGRFPFERVSEALGQGFAQSVWFCIIWVVLVGSLRQVLEEPLQDGSMWFHVPIRGVVTHFLVGCAIGWFIPTMYRNAYLIPTGSEPNKPEPLADGGVPSMLNKPRPAE